MLDDFLDAFARIATKQPTEPKVGYTSNHDELFVTDSGKLFYKDGCPLRSGVQVVLDGNEYTVESYTCRKGVYTFFLRDSSAITYMLTTSR